MPQHRPPPAVFDFSTFLDAPSVAAQVKQYGAPQIIDIPQTLIPSPLAPHLAPNTVEKLRDFLVGDGSSAGHARGAEVWRSWKRAWDLWNNHYIEGRVSPIWIREEYERLKKEIEEARDSRRKDEQIRRIRTRHRPGHNTAIGPATIFSATQPEAGPGKFYRQTTETRPAGTIVVPKMESRPKPGSTREHRRKGEVVPVYGDRFVTEIVRVERVVPKYTTPLRRWTDVINSVKDNLLLPERSQFPGSTETIIEYTLEERQVMKFGCVDIVGDKISPNLMSYEEVNQNLVAYGTLPGGERIDPPVFISQRPKMWYPVTEPCLDGTRTLTVDETVAVIEFGDIVVETLEEGEGLLLGWVEMDIPDVDMDADYDLHDRFGELPVVDEEPAIFYKRADKVERADGFSGGFFPMKSIDPYPEPEEADEDDVESKWLDVIQNTVWRPCRVGELTLRIEMDEPFEVVAAENGLEFDGGVDCGRSPYPVLRSVTEHFKISQGSRNLPDVFRKKKMWDGVTGTIFNMPVKPLENEDSEDERADGMSLLYGDFFRDEANKHRHDCFPLNIRRVARRSDKNYPARQFAMPVLEDNETLVRYPWHIPEGKYDHVTAFEDDLSPYDPWKVTAEQKQKREVPVRRYPPAQSDKCEGHEDLLLVDDTIWREELEDDDYGRWKYYVTNLHGGTLLINGKEIKINQIAGPLPEFAVIETPGGQISFWWGPNGRNHLGGNPGLNHESAWRSLRSRDNEFSTVALTAGQEWDYKIRERITKEFSGNEWEDDKQWEDWKKAVVASEEDPKSDADHPDSSKSTLITLETYEATGVPTGSDVVQPESFPTDTDELMWLHTKAEPLFRVIEAAKTNNFIEPLDIGMGFFPGAKRPFVRPEIVAQQQAIGVWEARLPIAKGEQRKLMNNLAKSKADRAEREKQANIEIGRKRAADSELQGGYPFKRTMADLVREEREAESNLERVNLDLANRQSNNVSRPVDSSVQSFDTAIRINLEQAFAAYNDRKLAAPAAGRPFTESLPTLQTAIDEHLKASRRKERGVAFKLQQRAAKGRVPIRNEDLPPGIDQVYASWKTNAKAAENERRKATALIRFNADTEALRLRQLKASQDEAAKRAVVEKKIVDESVAATSKVTPADKSLRERNLARKHRLLAMLEVQKTKLSAALSTTTNLQVSPLQHFNAVSSHRPPFQNVNNLTSSTGSQAPPGVHSVSTAPPSIMPSQETYNEQLAILADINATLVKRRADLEANIIIRAEQAGQTVNTFLQTQGHVSKEEYIRLMLKNDTDVTLPTKVQPTPLGSTGIRTAETLPRPSDTPLSSVLTNRLGEYRGYLRMAVQRNLRRRAVSERKTQLQIVNTEGYQDIQAYLDRKSNSIRLEDVNDDVPIPKFPPPLPANAAQAQKDNRTAIVGSLEADYRENINVQLAKKGAIGQRIKDAEDFELAARLLERNRPARVDLGATKPREIRREGQEEIFLDI
ncbi:uncharacterized protein RSE6_05748 [Rhynchosporium secalis]|uniref:Uncharacterized protein n=1 Tax=Rhynchosporium secalis TaxID=38038 RepID=A0A1E1M8L3_RHYSE|nr:uncharacterized protein RSE6_05748 [Rhynchosporium secalis]